MGTPAPVGFKNGYSMGSSKKTTYHEPLRDILAITTSRPFMRGSDTQGHLSTPIYTLRRVQIMFGGLSPGWDRQQGQGSGVFSGREF